jgi:hypothetical protein
MLADFEPHSRALSPVAFRAVALSPAEAGHTLQAKPAAHLNKLKNLRFCAGEKEKRVTLELLDCKPLEHPALLQYLARLGIDRDIAC